MSHQSLEWEAPEHNLGKKSSDWFWAVGIITVSAVVTSVIFHNILFAGVILIGSIALTMYATKEPSMHRYVLADRGVHIGDLFYPFTSLESFWIEDEVSPHKMLIQSQTFLMPYLIIPLANDEDYDEVRDFMLARLNEVEHHESILHKLFDYLGF